MPKGVANKRYTPEFKKKAIETMLQEKLSYKEKPVDLGQMINELRHGRESIWRKGRKALRRSGEGVGAPGSPGNCQRQWKRTY